MDIVRREPHRWWLLLLTIAGSVLATADAPAPEMAGESGFAGPCVLSGSLLATRGTEAELTAADGRSTVRSGRDPRLGFHAEDYVDRTDGEDDTDAPARAWFRDMIRSRRSLIVADSGSRSGIVNTPPLLAPSFQQLRC